MAMIRLHPRRAALRLIAAYRDSGGGRRWFGVDCNFEPSCSAYAGEAIARYGLLHGGSLAWHRIRRCRARDSVCRCLEPVPDPPCAGGDDARSARG